MKLSDFERSADREFPRFVTQVPDASGAEAFEMRIAGPGKVVSRMFKDADLDVTIDSAQDDSKLKEAFEAQQPEHRRAVWELASLEDADQLLKPSPPDATRDSSVFVSLRPVKGEGTPFFFTAGGFFVPAGISLFFFGLVSVSAFGSVRPATGDQDLRLRLFAPNGPVVATSTFSGTTVDSVGFSVLFFPFVPVFDLRGFASGICANFTAFGV
jgi:hypothetical protein